MSAGGDVVKLVAFREIRQRLRARSFAVFTALLCIGIIALGFLNSILNDDSPTSYDVATVGELAGTFADDVDDLAAALGVEVELTTIASRAEAETAVSDDDVDAAVDPATGDVLWRQAPVDELSSIVNGAWQAAEAREAASAAGLDAAQTEALLSPAPLNEVLLEPDDDDDGLGIAIGMASAILLFISISTFGGYVLMGVVEEKSTGVVEILLSHVKPHQLLTGKVLGIGAVAMIQYAAAIASALVSLRISGATVPSDVWVGLPATILWFVAGFVLYSTLFALAGVVRVPPGGRGGGCGAGVDGVHRGLPDRVRRRQHPRRGRDPSALHPAALRAPADAPADGHRVGIDARDRGRRDPARGGDLRHAAHRRSGVRPHAAAPWLPPALAPGTAHATTLTPAISLFDAAGATGATTPSCCPRPLAFQRCFSPPTTPARTSSTSMSRLGHGSRLLASPCSP